MRDWPAGGLAREGQAGRYCSCGRGCSGDRGGDGDAVGGLGWREAGDGSGREAEGDHGRAPQRQEAKRRGEVRVRPCEGAEDTMWESGEAALARWDPGEVTRALCYIPRSRIFADSNNIV